MAPPSAVGLWPEYSVSATFSERPVRSPARSLLRMIHGVITRAATAATTPTRHEQATPRHLRPPADHDHQAQQRPLAAGERRPPDDQPEEDGHLEARDVPHHQAHHEQDLDRGERLGEDVPAKSHWPGSRATTAAATSAARALTKGRAHQCTSGMASVDRTTLRRNAPVGSALVARYTSDSMNG